MRTTKERGLRVGLQLYDTLTGEKRDFAPWDGKTVRMYVCGVTPYDTTHIGHAFTYLHVRRPVRYCGTRLCASTYVQNVTDIDDDILKRAKRDGERVGRTSGDRADAQLYADMRGAERRAARLYPRADEVDPEDRRDRERWSSGARLRARAATSTSASRSDPDYGALSTVCRGRDARARARARRRPGRPAQGRPARFRALAGAGAPGEPAWAAPGGRPAGLAHRVLGAWRRSYLGPRSTSTAAAPT